VDSVTTKTEPQIKVEPLLLEVADVVNTTLDLDTTLRRVAELVRRVSVSRSAIRASMPTARGSRSGKE
jgi:hypothetical protein